jgi:5-methylcytosine-specific restriction endonuclease McrA
MLTVEVFKKRADSIYAGQHAKHKKRLAKLSPKGVSIDLPPSEVLPFSRQEFRAWLWKQVGLGASLCPYCRTPIDILSLEIDHSIPVRRGGSPGLDNQKPTCKRCNTIKGELTHDEFAALVQFLDGPGASFRQRLEGIIILGYEGRVNKFFGRGKGQGKASPKGKRVQSRIDFGLGAF